jgi:hypothetical protein
LSTSGLIGHSRSLDDGAVRYDAISVPMFIDGPRTTHLLLGEHKLRAHLGEILELRRRCGQADDLTTDPEYFIAANTLGNRRCSAVLIRRDNKLEACVLFYEHTRFGIGLGLFRGGDYIGESLVAGPKPLRVQFVYLATQALLKQWRVHGVSLSIRAATDECIAVMGPASNWRRFCGTEIQHKLPLANTYERMLAGLGPRTRRSLSGKRQQLEKSANVKFIAELGPEQSLEVMLELRPNSMPPRIEEFFRARYRLLLAQGNFFSMGMRLPDGPWLSFLSGWRRNGVTYVDLQLNDKNYKKESLSAVMRAFLLEHEIGRKQELINFVGGSSLLLRRYCEPIEPCTDIFFSKPGLRSNLFETMAKRVRAGSVYERLKPGVELRAAGEGEN